MGSEEFFDAIKARCSNEKEYAAELLKARGFLLEDGELALSDNSHKDDGKYLRDILQAEKMGDVRNGKIIISSYDSLENLFSMKYVGGMESFCDRADWVRFQHDDCAPKICVYWLEPFIARYIKSISACGVRTCGSCDGNHPERRNPRIVVETVDDPHTIWHCIICDRILFPKFRLHWNNRCRFIHVTEDNKWKTYIELNRAAEYLYNHRIMLRKIRCEAKSGITSHMAKHMPFQELSKLFSDRANELMDSCEIAAPRRFSSYKRPRHSTSTPRLS